MPTVWPVKPSMSIPSASMSVEDDRDGVGANGQLDRQIGMAERKHRVANRRSKVVLLFLQKL